MPKFPAETPPYDCSNTELNYGGTADGVDSATLYWTPLWTSQNPFRTVAQGSNCQFPQLTAGGFQDSEQHGKDLFSVYHDLLHFLPSSPNSEIRFRVTNNVITSQVAAALIGGMFPSIARSHTPISVQIENDAIDSLEPTYSCPGADALSSSYGVGSTDPAWTAHLNETQSLRSALNAISGVSSSQSDWQQSWDHYFDNLSSRQCHAFPLPCNNSATSTAKCVSQDQADEVFRLGQYEYAYLYRAAKQSLRFGTAEFGVWLAEFVAHVQAVTAGTSSVKYHHNVAHDGSMSRLLAVLQTEIMVWPGMGSELAFEVYSKGGSKGSKYGSRSKQWYVRILWGGQVFRSSSPAIGKADMIPLDKLLDYINGLIGEKTANVVTLCNSS